LTKALNSAALDFDLKINIVWIESTDLELELERTDSKTCECQTNEGKLFQKEVSGQYVDNNGVKNEPCKKDDDKFKDKEELNSNESKNDTHVIENKKMKEENAWKHLKSVDGILIPGGFGDRGIEGKILAIEYARTHRKPFLGICLGMQCAIIEYARHVCQLKNANSAEFDPSTNNQVVIFMPEISPSQMGGTMRLGSRVCHLQKNSIAYQWYQSAKINERHRHRYEVNPEYVKELESKGLYFSGKDESGQRMEIVELPVDKHPFFFCMPIPS